MSDPLARLPGVGYRHQPSAEHELTTAIRRCVLHSRSQSTSQVVERLRGARVSVSVEQVEVGSHALSSSMAGLSTRTG